MNGIENAMRLGKVTARTYYCVDINTLCFASRGFWPTPVELHIRLAIRQLAHGDSLSQRI